MSSRSSTVPSLQIGSPISRSRHATPSERRCRGLEAAPSGAARGYRSSIRATTLNYVRSLIERRREFADAPYETLPSSPGVWAYARGGAVCVVNLSDRPATHEGHALRPWEAVVL